VAAVSHWSLAVGPLQTFYQWWRHARQTPKGQAEVHSVEGRRQVARYDQPTGWVRPICLAFHSKLLAIAGLPLKEGISI